jgi:hypothetical protein
MVHRKRSPGSENLDSRSPEKVDPSPEGRRWPKGPGEGAKILLFTPHPPLRVTLSLRERDSQNTHLEFREFAKRLL